MRVIHSITTVIICFFAASLLRAQPLADQVPGDAMIYIGWCGSESMPAGYEASHLKAFLDSSNIPAVFNELVPQLVARAALEDREAGEGLGIFTGIAGPMFRHPTAIYFGGIDFTGPQPMPRIGVICKAGNDLKSITDKLTQLKAKAGDDAPINWTSDKDTIRITIGAKQEPLTKEFALGVAEPFKTALAKVQANAPAAVLYVDAEKILAMIDAAAQQNQDPKFAQYYPRIREASGLKGLKRIVCTSGFDGKDWMDQLFVEAPNPRKGLLALCTGAPVPDELLRTVPATATYVAAGSFDLAGFIDGIRSMVGEVDKNAQMQVDRGLGLVTLMIGKNFQKDVLEPLGSQWAMYMDPNTAGVGIGGIVIVNKLKDPKKAEQGIASIAMFISNSASSLMQKNGFVLSTRQVKVGDVNVNYLATPLISPAWAIKDGNLYIALFPQVAATAARFASTAGQGEGVVNKSILDNPEFVALRQRLAAGQNVSGLSFMDLRRGALQSYQGVLVVSRLALGMADIWGVKSPELVLPPLQDILPHLSPMGAVSWSDDAGFHMKSVTPFPGAGVLGGGANMAAPLIGMQAMGMSVLLPSLNRARETANRVKCASNERQIGQALLLYANDHQRNYPPNLGELIKTEDISADVFTCPAGNTRIPQTFKAMTKDEWAAWVNEHSDYMFLGAGKTYSAQQDVPMLYEKFTDHDNDGINILFADGHVEFFNASGARQVLQQAGVATP